MSPASKTDTAIARAAVAPSRAAVWAALGEVLDPELDEPVTDLGFVSSCEVDADGAVRVRLRLPTYFCAPNFAYLMLADVRAAVAAVPGVRRADVALDDHFAAASLNAGVAAGAGFVATFDGLAVTEPDELRRDFLRKAVLAATDRVARLLVADGYRPEELAGVRLGDLPSTAEVQRLRDRRARLGLPSTDHDPFVVDAGTGEPVAAAELTRHLHRARLTRVSVETNGDLCRGLLRQRYRDSDVIIGPTRRPAVHS